MKLNNDHRRMKELFATELGQEVLKYLLETEVLASTSTSESDKIIFQEGRRSLVLDILSIANRTVTIKEK